MRSRSLSSCFFASSRRLTPITLAILQRSKHHQHMLRHFSLNISILIIYFIQANVIAHQPIQNIEWHVQSLKDGLASLGLRRFCE